MKSTLLLLLFFFAYNAIAQITLEHTYNSNDSDCISRIKLEYSGEKYYALKISTNELFFYNSDHTLWKTIVLRSPMPNSNYGPARVKHVSEAKLNLDTNIEIIYDCFNFSSNNFDCKIISEDGTNLLTVPNASGTYLNEIPGLPDKLIIIGKENSRVYSIPELVLENTYSYENVKRIKLENSGEKYYLLDKLNNTAIIYNSNHSLWKTVSLPKPTNAIYTDIDFISETKINPDALVEIGYSFLETVSNSTTYSSKIVNENNVELLTVPNSKKLQISSIEGFQDKLMADIYMISFPTNSRSNIYTLPTLSLENAYENEVSRVKLENSDEKYFTSYKPLNNQLVIYNSNHTLWKTIDLPILVSNGIYSINYLSETKVNTDALIEFSYTYATGLLAFDSEYSSKVINENGIVLLENNYFGSLLLNEISGLQNKLIGCENQGTSAIYSTGNLSTSDFIKKTKVVIAPNPAKSFINLNSLSSPIIEVAIYNTIGILIKRETSQNITKIDVNQLPAGIYIVNLTDFNNQKSTHKITIAH